MFFSTQLLEKKGILAIAWLCAHDQFKKLGKSDLKVYDLSQVCLTITNPGKVPFSLRTSGQLMYGVVQIYRRKVEILLRDSSDIVARIRIKKVSAQVGNSSDDEASDIENAAEAPVRRERHQRESRRGEAVVLADPLFDFDADPHHLAVPEVPEFDRDYDYAGAMSQLGALSAIDLGVPLHILEQKRTRAASTNPSSHSTRDEPENVAAGAVAAAAGGALDYGAAVGDARGPSEFPPLDDFPAFPDLPAAAGGLAVDGGVEIDFGAGPDGDMPDVQLAQLGAPPALADAVSLASDAEPPRKVRRADRVVAAVVDVAPLFDLRKRFDANVPAVTRRIAPFCPTTLSEIAHCQAALIRMADVALMPRHLPSSCVINARLARVYADAFRQSLEAAALADRGTSDGHEQASSVDIADHVAARIRDGRGSAVGMSEEGGGIEIDFGGLDMGAGDGEQYGGAAAPLVSAEMYSRDGDSTEARTNAPTQVSSSASNRTSNDPDAQAAEEKGPSHRHGALCDSILYDCLSPMSIRGTCLHVRVCTTPLQTSQLAAGASAAAAS